MLERLPVQNNQSRGHRPSINEMYVTNLQRNVPCKFWNRESELFHILGFRCDLLQFRRKVDGILYHALVL